MTDGVRSRLGRLEPVASVRRARVPLFSVSVGGLALLLLLLYLPLGLPGRGQLLAAVGVAVGFALAETLVLHVEIGDDASTASASGLPLAVGLLLLSPVALVMARLLGALVGLGLARRQSAAKLGFNLAQFGLEVVVALLVLRAFPGVGRAGPAVSGLHRYVLPDWVAVSTACTVSAAVTGLAVLTVISLSAGRPQFQDLAAQQRDSLVMSVVAATIGVLSVWALRSEPASAAPLLALGAVAAFAYRGHTALRLRHDRLSTLYGFVRQVSTAGEADDTVDAVLRQTLDLLHAEVAVLTLVVDADQGPGLQLVVHRLDAGGQVRRVTHTAAPVDWPVARCLSTGQPMLGQRGHRDRAVAAHLEHLGVRDGVLVAVPGPERPTGTLFVGSRRGEHATFEQADVLALEGVAGHTAVALQNGRLVDRLRYESRHDPLTGLPNRTEFVARLTAQLRSGAPVASVLLMDLDRFKDVNDTLGHAAGDRLLQRVADRLSAGVDAGSSVARLGGDEFAVVLPGRDVAAALAVAVRLRAVLEQPVDVEGMFVDVGVSIGAAAAPVHGDTASVLLRRADIAMYDAKAGNGLAAYDPGRDDSSTSRLALVAQLRAALVQDEFVMHYQPQVDADGRTVRLEALLRWQSPQRGLVMPDDFLPVAERAGLLQDLTAWVLRASLGALQVWRAAGRDVGVAVNLSPRNLLDPGLAELVRAELSARQVPPDRLTLEITEGTIMAEPDRSVQTLRDLRTTGVRLSVDDFGTGYSSLAYLQRLPVDELKIDKSFVRGLQPDGAGSAIVRTVLALAASLHLEVVAEGVEDEASRRHLSGLGCGLLQGFHLGRPMPAAEVLPWLRTQDAAPGVADVVPLPRRRAR